MTQSAARTKSSLSGSVHVLGPAAPADLLAALQTRGTRVRVHADLASLLASLEEGTRGRVVVPVPESASRETLAAVAALRRLEPELPIVMLLEAEPTAPSWLKATALTPSCFPAALDPASVAEIVVRTGPSAGPPPLKRYPKKVVITLGESVVVDDRPVYLGVAERNFLFMLAQRQGHRIPKHRRIEAGPGHSVAATACRRRLGQRLGPELAELLVPNERFEPYRLRDASEIESISAGRGVTPVALRVVGRAEVRLGPRYDG